MPTPGEIFAEFLLKKPPSWKLPSGIGVLKPYSEIQVQRLLKLFCEKFYSGSKPRILMIGINPGRKGGGLTGIPFTDTFALEESCGLSTDLPQSSELSSRFIYKMIEAYGGAPKFYDNVLLSALCPLGFVRNGKNFNFYDNHIIVDEVKPYIIQHLDMCIRAGVRTDVVISLGKKNGQFLAELNGELQIFDRVVALEHPRFVMQYRSSQLKYYINQYLEALTT
ncbi:MAG: DUF4918 family protein [Bacteroidetes bacterium]|nr:DUF4918 family protein [Bacteroidota bacterium]